MRDGQAAILVRIETTPDDLPGMHAADGVLTAAGGLTSHAAIVARGIGKPAVCGTGLEIDAVRRTVRLGDLEVAEGDAISIDGSTGAVVVGELPIIGPQAQRRLRTLLGRPTASAGCGSAPTPTPRTTSRSRSSTGRRASACAGPSISSSGRGCPSSSG
ncbi:MAG: PEP-utilizing enzyme [Solirubrobacterales bacterium]